jgi:hypothetical protein
MEAHFDNTAENPANPHSPPKVVSWGDQTTDEMCIGIFEFVVADEGAPAGLGEQEHPPAPVERRKTRGPDRPDARSASPGWAPSPTGIPAGEPDGGLLPFRVTRRRRSGRLAFRREDGRMIASEPPTRGRVRIARVRRAGAPGPKQT